MILNLFVQPLCGSTFSRYCMHHRDDLISYLKKTVIHSNYYTCYHIIYSFDMCNMMFILNLLHNFGKYLFI